jgi:hypothetical protein
MKRQAISDERGAVFVEHIIAFLPVMFFFLATWQLIELCAAHLVIRRAASAAARAAVVVLPDDPYNYGGVDPHVYDGARKADIENAAGLVLMNNPHISPDFDVHIDQPGQGDPHGPLTARVSASFHCFAGWVSLVCAGNSRRLTAEATYAYQGAQYTYEMIAQ